MIFFWIKILKIGWKQGQPLAYGIPNSYDLVQW
jgi:hypothetical protein